MKSLSIMLNEQLLIDAYVSVKDEVNHPDAPSLGDIVLVRDALAMLTEQKNVICCFWLRNEIVKLRKANKLPKQGE